jgi:4-hydroxy-2-oxoglutarate aldolase
VSLNKEVSGTYGVAGVKAAMDIVGYSGGSPRRPLKSLSEEQKEDLKKKLLASGFLKTA